MNTPTHNNNNNIQNAHIEQWNKDIPQGRRQDPMQKTVNNPREDSISTQQSEKVVKTRHGRTIKKPDRLTYG